VVPRLADGTLIEADVRCGAAIGVGGKTSGLTADAAALIRRDEPGNGREEGVLRMCTSEGVGNVALGDARKGASAGTVSEAFANRDGTATDDGELRTRPSIKTALGDGDESLAAASPLAPSRGGVTFVASCRLPMGATPNGTAYAEICCDERASAVVILAKAGVGVGDLEREGVQPFGPPDGSLGNLDTVGSAVKYGIVAAGGEYAYAGGVGKSLTTDLRGVDLGVGIALAAALAPAAAAAAPTTALAGKPLCLPLSRGVEADACGRESRDETRAAMLSGLDGTPDNPRHSSHQPPVGPDAALEAGGGCPPLCGTGTIAGDGCLARCDSHGDVTKVGFAAAPGCGRRSLGSPPSIPGSCLIEPLVLLTT
jgi:hypothetical protein